MSGFGFAVPPKILNNADLVAGTNITDEWIVSRTGISFRHVLDSGLTGTDLALAATRLALKNAGRAAEEITHILYATCTPDACCPSAACTLSHKLQITGRMAVDINAACAGFVNGMELAAALAARTPHACILLVAAESLSHRCNRDDPATAVLFGDGAGAVLVTGTRTPSPEQKPDSPQGEIIDVILGSDGDKDELLLITGGFSASPYALGEAVGPDYFIRMKGGLVFKRAVRSMTACCRTLLERNGLTPDDIDCFIPHQANLRIIEAVGARLGFPSDKVFINVHKYGNTSAASIPLALGEAIHTGVVRQGMRALVTSFGGGLTWGAGLIQF